MVGDRGVLGIGMVGYAFMGRAHPQAWRNVASFFDLPLRPRMAAICAHAVDLAQHLAGDRIAGVSALTETFVRERPLVGGGGARGPVTVDDAALFVGRFAGGALGSFEATRCAAGHTEGLSVEVNGELGSIAWELGALNELRLFDGREEPATQGFRRIQVTRAGHPYAGAWWPDGHTIGYEHTFTHEVRDLLWAIADGRDPVPSFADGLQVPEVLDAVQRSAASSSSWTQVER